MTSPYAMTKTDSGNNATWTKIVVSKTDYRDIMWSDLLEVARDHWDWVKTQPNAYTGLGSCLVAALFLPNTAGGVIFLSTIPRGTVFNNMATSGPTSAAAWWRATTGGAGVSRGFRLHAEDGAEYLFETSRYAAGIVRNGAYHTPDRDNHHARMKLAVWGRHVDSPQQGESIALCTTGTKVPKCPTVARTLNIDYCTSYKVRYEEQAAAPPARTPAPTTGRPTGRPAATTSGRQAASTTRR